MNPLIEHVQSHLNVYIVVALAILPPVLFFRKHTFPVIYHTFEYLCYCGIVHVFVGGVARLFSWFRSETKFKNYDGSIDSNFAGYSTPIVNFWDKTLYSPTGMFYFEIALALVILYVVIVLRPTSFKKRNWKISVKKDEVGKAKARYDRSRANKIGTQA